MENVFYILNILGTTYGDLSFVYEDFSRIKSFH